VRVRVALVALLAVAGGLGAAGALLVLYLEASGFGVPGGEPRTGSMLGAAAGVVAGVTVPVLAAVLLLGARWWWALVALIAAGLVALAVLGLG